MFFFKDNVITVDAFVEEKYSFVETNSPIDYAHKFYPEWWKKLPKPNYNFENMFLENSTMKSCVGFVEHYKNSLIIPMWSDMAISVDEIGLWKYHFSDGMSFCESHGYDQRIGFYPYHTNVKIVSPWMLMCKSDINFMITSCFWNHTEPKPYETCLGTIDFYSNNSTNVNLLIEKNTQFMIPFGEPLIHIIPLSEKKINLKRHVVSASEFLKIRNKSKSIKFTNRHKTIKKILKNKDSEKKCPFGFK